MCQRDNNPTKEQTTAASMQRETPEHGGVLQLAPKQLSVIMDVILNSEIYTRN